MALFNKKADELPKPATTREELEVLQKQLDQHFKDLEDQEKKQPKKTKDLPEPVFEDLPVIQDQKKELLQDHKEVTTLDLQQMITELYQIMSNRFDQIYFKIDQTQDMIIKNKQNGSN